MFEMVTVLSILGYGLFLNRLFRWPIESTFFFIGSALVCVLYAFALVDLLQPGSLLLMSLGCILAVVFLLLKGKENSLGDLLQPGVVFFLLGAAGLYLLTNTDYFSVLLHWDDYSNWARTSKVIFLNNGLVQLNDPVWQKDYPPGAALFHYYIFQLSGFSVPVAFFAQGLLLLAACASILNYTHKRRWIVLVFIAVFFYFLLHSFGLGFHTLTVDLLIAVFFGCGVSAYWISDRSIGAIVRLMPVIMVLPLIKIMGVAFAAIMIAIVVSDQLWRLKCRQSSVCSVGISLLLLPLLFLSFMSWQQHFKEMGASKTFNADVSVEKIIDAFSEDKSTEYQKLIAHNFVERLLASKTFIVLLILFIMAFVIVRKREKEGIKRHAVDVLFFWLFVGLTSYLLLLLVLYLFFFGDYEAVRLASFNRYAKTYFIGFSIVGFTVLFYQHLEESRNNIRRYLLYFLILLYKNYFQSSVIPASSLPTAKAEI